jgi:hypothetical protein
MTLTDILDGGLATVRADPPTVLTVVAVFVVPVQILTVLLTRSQYGDVDASSLFDQSPVLTSSSETFAGVDLAVALLPTLALPFVAGAIGRLVSAWYVGTKPTAGAALRSVLNRRALAALLIAWVLIHITELLSLIAAPFVIALWLVTAPAIVLERLGPIEGMRRSSRLVRRRYWRCMGIYLVAFLVESLIQAALGTLETVALFFDWGWIVGVALGSLASIVTIAFVTSATVMLYLDLRIRTEGLDIEVDAAAVFDHAA